MNEAALETLLQALFEKAGENYLPPRLLSVAEVLEIVEECSPLPECQKKLRELGLDTPEKVAAWARQSAMQDSEKIVWVTGSDTEGYQVKVTHEDPW